MDKQNIVLIGFMGTFKSSVGKKLALQLGYTWVDLDAEIENHEDMRIADIFTEKGELYFRDMETDICQEVAQKTALVISTGGGVPLRAQNMVYLKEHGFVVWLTATPKAVFERICKNKNRPVLKNRMNTAAIGRLMTARKPYYQKSADFTIDTTNYSSDEVAQEIYQLLTNAKGV